MKDMFEEPPVMPTVRPVQQQQQKLWPGYIPVVQLRHVGAQLRPPSISGISQKK